MPARTAVVIGIENTAGMQPLPGAVQGANAVADWADGEGWEVVKITDEGGRPVTRVAILEQIHRLVESRTVAQLLIYFAGHGQCWGLDADFWILSAGTSNPGDGVNVGSSIRLARQSGIREISVVADACRLIGRASDAGLSLVSGPIFPASGNVREPIKIDRFYATRPTQAALELQTRVDAGVPRDQATSEWNAATVEANGLFTQCLLDALHGRDDRAKSRLSDGRIVVNASRLAAALNHALPRATGRLPGGFAQHPDCRIESSQVFAEVQASTQCQLRVEARFADASPAEGARLELLRHDAHSPELFVTERRIRSWSVSENLPWGNVYGVRAELPDHRQDPNAPNPLICLNGDELVVVTMLAERAPVPTVRGPIDWILERTESPEADLRLDASYVLTPDGRRLDQAPEEGVFSVMHVDGLTGEEAQSTQFLHRGAAPAVAASASSREAARAIGEAAELSGRHDFQTKTGLSITGARPVGVYGPGEIFEKDGMDHVGCDAKSSSLVLNLDDERYAALACFEQYVGRVRVGPVGVQNLQYLPSAGSDAAIEMGDESVAKQVQTALAIAEAAARRGRFEIAIDEARPVAKILRRYKHQNPVYGVFAAYAYHQAGDLAAIRDMIGYFESMGQTVPFDLVLLAGIDPKTITTSVAPGYPMLTEGWTHLAADVHPAVADARRSVAPTLWATIVGAPGRRLGEAISQGEV